MNELGIMGGTFNPIRTRELLMAQCALDQYQLNRVTFVPNGCPPHKHDDLLDKEWRFEMVAAAVAGNDQFEASRLEIDREGISWTVDTMKLLKQLHGEGTRLNFIMGEDNVQSLKTYERRSELQSYCRFLIVPRFSTDAQSAILQWKEVLPDGEVELVDCPPDSSSSTLVRRWIREGRSVRYLVPESVYAILLQRRHYLPGPDSLQTMRRIA
jgi:nicotinate-nucleotide adenylyltransferase